MKKILSIGIAAFMTLGISNAFVSQQVGSEAADPKVVFTDTWTTSYFIDDEPETLYPYIQCTAKIFDDGTLRVIFGNTHKLEDIDDKEHRIFIVGTSPMPSESQSIDTYMNGKSYIENSFELYPVSSQFEDNKGILHYNGRLNGTKDNDYYSMGLMTKGIDTVPEPDFSFWENSDISYCPSYDYFMYELSNEPFYGSSNSVGMESIECMRDLYGTDNKLNVKLLKVWSFYGKPSELPSDKTQYITFKPQKNTDLTQTYKFRILSHDITITPELLNISTSESSTPEKSDADKIKELEEKVKTLTEENEKLKSRNVFDLNNDGAVNVLDLISLKKYLLGK